MSDKIKIVGFTGSLRRHSFNEAALRAAQELLPENAELNIISLAALPFFNEDLEAEGIPVAVAEFREQLAAADAVLISSPEYNYSMPPALKNALDWASRGDNPPLSGKPVAIMSASPSKLGGARVQYQLRQVCVALNLQPVNQPEVFIAEAHTKFDTAGNLVDVQAKQLIAQLLKALVAKVKR